MPLIGAVADTQSFQQQYADLAHGRAYRHYDTPDYRGLYVTLAHGSRGLLSTLLAAELLAASLNQTPQPIENSVRKAVSAQRFMV